MEIHNEILVPASGAKPSTAGPTTKLLQKGLTPNFQSECRRTTAPLPTDKAANNTEANLIPVEGRDVLCERGEFAKRFNEHYRILVRRFYPAYRNSTANETKRLLATEILNTIRANGGRFFSRVFEDNEGGNVERIPMTLDQSVRKVMKALKDLKRGEKHHTREHTSLASLPKIVERKAESKESQLPDFTSLTPPAHQIFACSMSHGLVKQDMCIPRQRAESSPPPISSRSEGKKATCEEGEEKQAPQMNSISNTGRSKFSLVLGSDVICGRGEVAKRFNAHYRDLIRQFTPAYVSSKSMVLKRSLANEICNIIKNQRGGRFFNGDVTHVLTNQQAVVKVMKALKDSKRGYSKKGELHQQEKDGVGAKEPTEMRIEPFTLTLNKKGNNGSQPGSSRPNQSKRSSQTLSKRPSIIPHLPTEEKDQDFPLLLDQQHTKCSNTMRVPLVTAQPIAAANGKAAGKKPKKPSPLKNHLIDVGYRFEPTSPSEHLPTGSNDRTIHSELGGLAAVAAVQAMELTADDTDSTPPTPPQLSPSCDEENWSALPPNPEVLRVLEEDEGHMEDDHGADCINCLNNDFKRVASVEEVGMRLPAFGTRCPSVVIGSNSNSTLKIQSGKQQEMEEEQTFTNVLPLNMTQSMEEVVARKKARAQKFASASNYSYDELEAVHVLSTQMITVKR